MARNSTVSKNSFLHNELYEYNDLSHVPPKTSGKVLPWPTKQTEAFPMCSDEIKKADEILRKLSQQPLHNIPSFAMPDTASLIPDRRISQKTTLQEEMPVAIRTYNLAVSAIKNYFLALSVKKALDIAPLEEIVTQIIESLERNNDALFYISKAYEHSVYIYAHSVNVCIYTSAVSLNCGKSHRESVSLGLAGLMHDAGMALLPMALLQSSGELSQTEQVIVKRHPIIGSELLSVCLNVSSDILDAVREHHERFDGSGYPAGLSGSDISFVGHIVAICGAFDAMTASRKHKKPITAYSALGEIFMQRNKHFHPIVLENFIKTIGIYPVGSVVILQDGYCGIVTASSNKNPTRPIVTLVMDPKGQTMSPLEFDMSQERLASIVQCVSAAEQGLNVHAILGVPEKLA